MRKVTPIDSHDHWADYAEMIQPPPPEFKKRKTRKAIIFDCLLTLAAMLALYMVWRMEV
jgi:hypothetical protein